jgi:hypothetical protein
LFVAIRLLARFWSGFFANRKHLDIDGSIVIILRFALLTAIELALV